MIGHTLPLILSICALTVAIKYAIMQVVRLGHAIAYLRVERIELLLQQLFNAFYFFTSNWHHSLL
jgi:hypothetical protein